MVRQVKLRNRNYWAWFAKEPVGNTHGHWSEYVMHATAIACNVTFVIGSSFFFSAVPEAWGPKAGATCFLVASIIMMITSVIGSLEHLAYLRTAPAAQKECYVAVGNATGERGFRRVLLATRGQGFLRVQLESLKEIAQLARLAHFWQVFPVLDRLGARVEHAFQSLQRQAAPPSRSLYVAAFALCPQGDTPPELGDYFVFAFPRFYFGLSEAERAPFARYAGAMLGRFLWRAENKEDLRQVALALHRLHFSNN